MDDKLDSTNAHSKGDQKSGIDRTQTEAPEAGGPNAPAAERPAQEQDYAAKRESNRKGGYGTG